LKPPSQPRHLGIYPDQGLHPAQQVGSAHAPGNEVEVTVIRLDASIVLAHSDQQQAGPTFKPSLL
jgi:hypothetical protein